jgi:hypothetical protein
VIRTRAEGETISIDGEGPRGDHHTILGFDDVIDLHFLQTREEQIDAAGFLARAGMQHNDLAAAR